MNLLFRADGPAIPRWLELTAIAALLLGLAVAAFHGFSRQGFSEDEFYQLAFVNQPLPSFFMQSVRLDQHPPFHFLQLKLWALVSDSDRWMLLNSLAWHIASCVVIFAVGRAWQGLGAGLLAVALYALIPQAVLQSHTLRMYAMIPALAVAAWWLNVSLLSGRERRTRAWVGLVVVVLALGYSHAIAFYFAAFIALAAAVQVVVEKPLSPAWKRWLWTQFGLGLALSPLLVLAAARVLIGGSGEAGGNSDPGNLVDHLGGMVAGWGMKWPLSREAGTALFLLAIGCGLWRQATRPLAVVMLIGPYVTAFVIGLVLAPMFKTPVYSAMLVPFACLVLGACLAHARAHGPAVLVLMALAGFIVPAVRVLNDADSGYKVVAEQVRQRAKAGDVVLVPKPYVYWAMARYAVGPRWGGPLDVMPALSGSWLGVAQKLGPQLTTLLQIAPRTQSIERDGIVYVIGDDALAQAQTARRVWVVQRMRYKTPVQLPASFSSRGIIASAGRPELLQVELFERGAD